MEVKKDMKQKSGIWMTEKHSEKERGCAQYLYLYFCIATEEIPMIYMSHFRSNYFIMRSNG